MHVRFLRLGALFLTAIAAWLSLCIPASADRFDFVPTGPTDGDTPTAAVRGADHSVWFTPRDKSYIGVLTRSGAIRKLAAHPQVPEIAVGSDDAIWFIHNGFLTQVDESFRVHEVHPLKPGLSPAHLTAGIDGDLWFVDRRTQKIVRVAKSGEIKAFDKRWKSISAMRKGPDGKIWFIAGTGCCNTYGTIGRIDRSGRVRLLSVNPPRFQDVQANQFALGQDGNFYYTERTSYNISRFTPRGAVTQLIRPFGTFSSPYLNSIAAGKDGDLWATRPHKVARITPSGALYEFKVPRRFGSPRSIVAIDSRFAWASVSRGFLRISTEKPEISVSGSGVFHIANRFICQSSRANCTVSTRVEAGTSHRELGRSSYAVRYCPPSCTKSSGGPISVRLSATGLEELRSRRRMSVRVRVTTVTPPAQPVTRRFDVILRSPTK